MRPSVDSRTDEHGCEFVWSQDACVDGGIDAPPVYGTVDMHRSTELVFSWNGLDTVAGYYEAHLEGHFSEAVMGTYGVPAQSLPPPAAEGTGFACRIKSDTGTWLVVLEQYYCVESGAVA